MKKSVFFAFGSFVAFAAITACGGPSKDATPPPAPSASSAPAPTDSAATVAPTSSAPPAAAPTAGEAQKLLVLGTACWFGGLWSDAEGDGADARKQAAEARCHDLVGKVWGSPDDKDHYERIRAFEDAAIDDFVGKVGKVAEKDSIDGPRKDALIKLVRAVAAAQREATEARRAAERVKRDLDHEPDKLTTDEAAAANALKATKALTDLLALDVADLTADAHAIGMITAMERVNISRGLPRHLKIYELGGTFNTLFGIAAPEVPTDATSPIKKGQYLKYIIDAAKAAGHPVPDTAKNNKQKESLAWAGSLQGLSDKMKVDFGKMSHDTPLYEVTERIIRRLDSWYNAEVTATTTGTQKAATPAAGQKGGAKK